MFPIHHAKPTAVPTRRGGGNDNRHDALTAGPRKPLPLPTVRI
jgi:hypothetical protein